MQGDAGQALTDLVMREQHGLVEDCPLHRLVAGRGGQRAIVVEVQFQVGRQQTRNVESRHQDFLTWEKKYYGSETGATPWRTTGGTSTEIMGSLALLLLVRWRKSSGFALEARESTCEQRAPWRAVLCKLCNASLLAHIQQMPAATSLCCVAGFSAGLQHLRQLLGGTGPYLLFGFCTDAQVFPDSKGSPLARPATQRPHSNDKEDRGQMETSL